MLSSLMLSLSLVLPVMNGTPGEVYDFGVNRKVHVIEFYFDDCPACNTNAPNVSSLAKKLSNKVMVQVLDVGIDRANSEYTQWVNKHTPAYPVLKDARRELAATFGVRLFPTTVVVGCDGTAVFKNVGVWSSDVEPKIVAKVDDALLSCGP